MYDMPVGLHRRRYEYSQARPTLPATAVNTANRGRTWQTDNDTHTQSKNSAVGFRGCVRVYIYNPVVVLAFSIFFFEILNRTTEMNWPNAVASDAILALFCCCCLYILIRNSTLFVSKKATSYAVFQFSGKPIAVKFALRRRHTIWPYMCCIISHYLDFWLGSHVC